MRTVGVIGGGQLGMMLGQAGEKIGVECIFLDPAAHPPALAAGEVIHAAYDDQAALLKLAQNTEVLTYEFENVSPQALERLPASASVCPPVNALRESQDRLAEKTLFTSLGISVPHFQAINSAEELRSAAAAFGYPCILKTRRMGYDGKGQCILKSNQDLEMAWDKLKDQNLILEQFISFDCEVSIIAVRSKNGSCIFYPLIENTHRAGILRTSICPSPKVTPSLQKLGESYATKVLEHLKYVGVLTIEFFVKGETLMANEMAPRVHNSGHWTIEGAGTSQFENHLRAILNMPLGIPKLKGHSRMFNMIGTIPPLLSLKELPGVFVHIYGKEPRPGRKLGHVTVCGKAEETANIGQEIERLIKENTGQDAM